MTETRKGILAMIGTCAIWGLSPIFYKLLVHVPATEVLAHRIFWSFVFFLCLLALQGRLGEARAAFATPRQTGLIALATLMVSANWFLFIYATQIDRNTETSLGYYIYPLVAVLIGRFVFAERLWPIQGLAVGLAALGVLLLAKGFGGVPWISLTLAITFALYGVIKKDLPLGPVVSVTCEVLVILPLSLLMLAGIHLDGQGAFGATALDSILLAASGPLTALPLVLFSFAARRLTMSTVGVMQYLNPTLQFFCAVAIFNEPFTAWHMAAFALIWTALALYSAGSVARERSRAA